MTETPLTIQHVVLTLVLCFLFWTFINYRINGGKIFEAVKESVSLWINLLLVSVIGCFCYAVSVILVVYFGDSLPF